MITLAEGSAEAKALEGVGEGKRPSNRSRSWSLFQPPLKTATSRLSRMYLLQVVQCNGRADGDVDETVAWGGYIRFVEKNSSIRNGNDYKAVMFFTIDVLPAHYAIEAVGRTIRKNGQIHILHDCIGFG
jgi:hypothetical protein